MLICWFICMYTQLLLAALQGEIDFHAIGCTCTHTHIQKHKQHRYTTPTNMEQINPIIYRHEHTYFELFVVCTRCTYVSVRTYSNTPHIVVIYRLGIFHTTDTCVCVCVHCLSITVRLGRSSLTLPFEVVFSFFIIIIANARSHI